MTTDPDADLHLRTDAGRWDARVALADLGAWVGRGWLDESAEVSADGAAWQPLRSHPLLAAALGRAEAWRQAAGAQAAEALLALDARDGGRRPARTPRWAKVSREQEVEAERLGVPVAYEEPVTGIRFVLVPGGSFLMGSPPGEAGRYDDEGPRHQVTLPAFYLSVHVVTNRHYRKKEPGHRSTANGDAYPVTEVSWDEAVAYANWLSALGEPRGYALPSEAQWEHACRAGSLLRWSFGDDPSRLGDYAWYGANSLNRPHPAGSKLPNRWGLHDMHGNVWEWCQDEWSDSYVGAPMDGRARGEAHSAALHVVRGGAWRDPDHCLRSAYRRSGGLSYRYPDLGFRLVRTIPTAHAGTSPGATAAHLPEGRGSHRGSPPGATPVWARASREQEVEAARLGVPVAYEEPMTGIRFVLVPGGSFLMGSPPGEAGRYDDEGPRHQVTLPAFYLSVHEVTNGQYRRKELGHRSTADGDAYPVTEVSWDEAVAYAEWLSALGEPRGYALPSEAQWEHACRAGSLLRWSFGDDPSRLGDYAWYGANSLNKPHPVGSKLPNRWGLHDMHGNVWEWCQDEWGDSYRGAPTDGRARGEGRIAALHAVRGGAWSDPDHCLRSAYRRSGGLSYRYHDLGFRLARAVIA